MAQTTLDPPLPTPALAPGKARPRARPQPAPADTDIAPARPAPPPYRGRRMRGRHWAMLLSFLLMVAAPAGIAAWYLWQVALDQYDSRTGFSVQREEAGSSLEILGGITEIAGSSSADTDILYQFIQSRGLIRRVDARLDLTRLFTRPEDPVFSLPPHPTIEDIERHWSRRVDVAYDTASRLIEVRVLAFDPADAQAVAAAILAESTVLLNSMNDAAREDRTRYAAQELARAKDRLSAARQALTAFRLASQIVDPAADVQGRMGLLNTLIAEQAAALIDLDLLITNTRPGDQRILQAEKRVEVIEARIRAERARFGAAPAEEDARYADLVGQFEALTVDLEFAQASYLSAMAAYDAAVAEAQRQSRYLATWLDPTRAETALYPRRPLLLALVAGFAFAGWLVLVLVFYALRDRR